MRYSYLIRAVRFLDWLYKIYVQVVIREFDLKTLKFLSTDTEQAFVLPECKSSVSYKTRDILLIGVNLNDGESMTDSGYSATQYLFSVPSNA